MTSYTLAEAKASFSKVIKEVEAGNTVQITKHGQPAAVLMHPRDAADKLPRGLVGCLKDEFADWKMPDDFDRICQTEIEAMFDGGGL
jgi:prevent-host-death family protein